jgi:transcriptional regulator with GAF, ATPase, and Fis domain
MVDIPSRSALAALTAAANDITSTACVGFAHAIGDREIRIDYAYQHGMGRWVLPLTEVAEVFVPAAAGVRQADTDAFTLNPTGALERFLHDVGVHRVVSMNMPGRDPTTRFFAGVEGADVLTAEQVSRLEGVAASGGDLLATPFGDHEAVEQLRRLELAASLLPTLMRVLDVREVFDQLSAIAKRALPHDLLQVILFSDDLTTVTNFARSGRGSEKLSAPSALSPDGSVLPSYYPPATIRAWQFDIIDDYLAHPLEQHSQAAKIGARSSLRVPIRFGDRVIGGVRFVSFDLARYTNTDVAIGRRLADHVAVALSHYQLAVAAQRTAALRERAANLDLLDELLTAAVDTGELADIFARMTTVAAKVLRHDASTLVVRLPGSPSGRVFASSGFPRPQPDVIEVPEDLLRDPQWDHHIFDDLSQRKESRYIVLADMGFQSLLRVPIRREGEFAAALIFLSNTRAAFSPTDVSIARRIAERLAIALAHDRELAAAKRADEAVSRAAQLEARVRALTDELDARTGYRRVVGESLQWRQVLTQATQVAATDTTVLLLGESGTGKEVIARFLHRGSRRHGGPFVALNCAALPEQLLEAELFGYERGAYTGATQSKPGQLEQAAGGTLFLDEVAEMSASAQAKFLRVLQEREFQRLGGTRVLRTDARVIAATNRDLPRDIANGKFREDLYYRLNVFAIKLPPLRERRADILPLSEAFLIEVGRGLGRPPAGISRDARQRLVEYHWPGNVRELRNILERAAILCDGGLITAEHLALSAPSIPNVPVAPVVDVKPESPPAEDRSGTSAAAPLPPTGELHVMERKMIEQALENARFNKSKAAKALGLTRQQLYIRLRRHGLDP